LRFLFLINCKTAGLQFLLACAGVFDLFEMLESLGDVLWVEWLTTLVAVICVLSLALISRWLRRPPLRFAL
jgi:hypothetical protein